MENFLKKEEKNRETLPAVTVDNNVILVNSEIELPFKIEKNKPTELGLFFTPDPKGQSVKNIEVMREHNRSGILGKVIFKDKQGRLYRDVDLKGIGFVELDTTSEKMTVRPPQTIEKRQTRGIASMFYIRNDWKMTEEFLNAGIRTYRIIAITELKEIIDKFGNKISISTAKKERIIREDDKPVAEIRAFGTRTRIADLVEISKQKRDALIEDAIKFVAEEVGINYKSFSKQDYFNWFIETMATNLARMHHGGWVHGGLSDHNITLDARVVDLDSVEIMDHINERKMAGELSVKSFDNDVSGLEVMASFLKGALGLGKEISKPDQSADDSGILYVDENVQEKIGKIYKDEVTRLEKEIK